MDSEKFNQFKETLTELILTNFNPCKGFKDDLNKCVSTEGIIHLFENNVDSIYEKLNGETIDELNSQIEDLNNKLEKSRNIVEELSYELNRNNLYHDELKMIAFYKYHNKYNPWEFEELLEKGYKINI